MNFFKNSFFYVVATLIAGVASYGFQLMVSRSLSVADFGEVQALLSLVAIIGLVGATLTTFIIRQTSAFASQGDYDANKDFLRWLSPIIIKVVILFLALIFALSPLIIRFLHLTSLPALYLIIMVATIGLVSAVYTGTLSGWQKFSWVNVSGIVSAVAKLGLGFLVVVMWPTVVAVSGSYLLSGIISLFILWYFMRRRLFALGAPDSVVNWRAKYFPQGSLLKIFLATAIFSSLLVVLSNLDVLIIKNVATAEFTGYYGVLGILGKIILWVNGAIIAVVLPMACARGHQGNRLDKKIYFLTYVFILLVGGSAIIAYYFMPEFIITLMFGARYAIFAPDLWLFGVMSLAWSALLLEANLAYAYHNHKISFVLILTIILMTLGLYIYHDTMRHAATGLIISLSLGYLLALVVNLLKKDKSIEDNPLPISVQ